jgi:hypothetical protein
VFYENDPGAKIQGHNQRPATSCRPIGALKLPSDWEMKEIVLRGQRAEDAHKPAPSTTQSKPADSVIFEDALDDQRWFAKKPVRRHRIIRHGWAVKWHGDDVFLRVRLSERLPSEPLADDLLRGAVQIGAHIGETEQRVYYVTETKLIPVGKLGTQLVAGKRVLNAFFAWHTPRDPPIQLGGEFKRRVDRIPIDCFRAFDLMRETAA